MGTFNLVLRSWPKTGFTAKQFWNKSRYILQRATDVVVIKFYTARGSNDCQTFDWMNSIKFKASLCQTLDVSTSKRMHPCLRYDFADRRI